jgi:hypothetical protein
LIYHLDTKNEDGKAFEPILNQFINNNWKDIVSNLMPFISKAIAKAYKDALNEVYIKKPFNNFFVE